MTPLTPEEARNQLVAADTLATMTVRGARASAFTTAGVGLLTGLGLVSVRAFGMTNPTALVISMIVYATALTSLMTWHGRYVRVAARGWVLLHFGSFVLTMALWSAGMVWANLASPSWVVFAPFCVLVALPMVLAGSRMARR
jgi:hypothetical protein